MVHHIPLCRHVNKKAVLQNSEVVIYCSNFNSKGDISCDVGTWGSKMGFID